MKIFVNLSVHFFCNISFFFFLIIILWMSVLEVKFKKIIFIYIFLKKLNVYEYQ